jgi:hypothetical protein
LPPAPLLPLLLLLLALAQACARMLNALEQLCLLPGAHSLLLACCWRQLWLQVRCACVRQLLGLQAHLLLLAAASWLMQVSRAPLLLLPALASLQKLQLVQE